MIRKGDAVGYKKSLNFRDAVLEDLLNLFVNKGVISAMKAGNQKSNKIALSNTLDAESDKIVHAIIKGKVRELKNFRSVDGKIIKPLYLFLDNEVLLYAKLRKLRFKTKEIKQDMITEFLNDLEKKHPEIKRAIVSSYLELYE